MKAFEYYCKKWDVDIPNIIGDNQIEFAEEYHQAKIAEITEEGIKGMAAEFATDKMGGYPAFPRSKKFHTEWSKIFNGYYAGAKAILSKLKGE